jgi:general secretion pathway protein C
VASPPKIVRWLEVIVVALCAALLAHATDLAIDSRLLELEAGIPSSSWASARAFALHTDPKPIGDILARNVFCSRCVTSLQTPASFPMDAPAAGERAGSLELLAIMFAPSPADRRWSVAVIRDGLSNTTGAYAIGSTLHGATVARIELARVFLRARDGRVEHLDLVPGGISNRSDSAYRSGDGIDALLDDIEGGISMIDEHRYRVERPILEKLLANIGALTPGMEVVLAGDSGKSAGVVLTRTDPNGVLTMLGFKDGDVISRINGLELGDPAKALALYADIRRANRVSVEVARAGQILTQAYDVR